MNPEPETRQALIVATGRYADSKFQQLRAPEADARALAAVLADPAVGNFEVCLAVDENQPQLVKRIARFFANRRPDDLLFLHLSCHGVKDAHGDLYLAATDTEFDLLSATGIAASWLNDQFSRTRSRRTVVLLDCCFSGSFPFGARRRGNADVNVPDQFDGHGRGLAVITASSAMEYAYEGDQLSGEGQPSFFTEAVVEGLRSGKADRDQDRWVSVQELYEYVHDSVIRKTAGQTPNIKSELEGPLYIARSIWRAPIEPVTLDSHLLALTEHRYAGARAGAVHELEALLSSRDPGIVLAVRQALERMVDDDSRRVSELAKAALTETPPRDRDVPPPLAPPTQPRPDDDDPPPIEPPPEDDNPPPRELPAGEPAKGSFATAAKGRALTNDVAAPTGRAAWLRFGLVLLVVAAVSLSLVLIAGDLGGSKEVYGLSLEMRSVGSNSGSARLDDEAPALEFDDLTLAGEPADKEEQVGTYEALLFDDLAAMRSFEARPRDAVRLLDSDGSKTVNVKGGVAFVSLPDDYRSYEYFGLAKLNSSGGGRIVLYQRVDRLS